MSKSKESGETTAEETIDTTTGIAEMPVENVVVTTEKVTTKKAKVALNSGKETTAEETIDTTTGTAEMPVENVVVTTEKVTTKKAKVALNSGKETTAAKKIGLSKFLEATPQKHGMVAILKRKCALEFRTQEAWEQKVKEIASQPIK